MAPRARIAKNKARLAAYEKLASQEYDEKEEELVIQIPPGPHLGDLVVRAQGVKKGYGDNLLFEDMNFAEIEIHTLADGLINEMHIGVKGTMTALFLKGLAQKVRRGLAGAVRAGRNPGGDLYG